MTKRAPDAGLITRRSLLRSAPAFGLAALGLGGCAAGGAAMATQADAGPALGDQITVDLHSHAGRVLVGRNPATGATRPFQALAAPMHEGGLNVVCLAIVADTSATRISADRRRIEPFRAPEPGELYALSQTSFARLQALVEREQVAVVKTLADLRAAQRGPPSIVVASEGADFLEGRIERVDEAYERHHLRQLQLNHYRVNELGDIQTEPPQNDGLTDFGAEVLKRCQQRGIVVDVAHASFAFVRRAAELATKPLVLSHTALVDKPRPRSRSIGPEHARLVASTGGLIGVWPSAGSFADLDAMAQGARRLADVVGVEHVGFGSDMLGFISPPVFTDYRQLPAYAQALARAGFTRAEVSAVLGGNYLRVAAACFA